MEDEVNVVARHDNHGEESGLHQQRHQAKAPQMTDARRSSHSALLPPQDEQERLRHLLATVPSVIWEAWSSPDDPSQQISYVSDYVETMLGYTQEEWTSTPNFWLTIVHPEDRERAARETAAIFASGHGSINQFRWVAKDGRVLWCEAHTTVLVDEDGRPIGMRGITMDISSRVEAEQAQADSEAIRRAIVENSLDCIITIDQHGNVLDWNPAAERTFGYSREQAVGREMAQLIIPERLRERHRRGIEHYLSTGEGPVLHQRLELPALRADGSEFPAELSITPIRLGDMVLFTGYLRDISQRKRAEEALARSHEINKTITDNATASLFMMDAQGRCTFMNPAAERMTGYAFEEVNGRILHDFIHYLKPDGSPYPISECPIDRALPQNVQIKGHEDVFATKDGRLFPVMCAASPIIENGVPVGTVIEARDISEEKAAQAALNRSAQEIRTIFESMTDAFFALDHEWRFTYINAEMERLLGLQRGDYLGTNIWERFPDAVGTDFWREYHRAVEQQVPVSFETYYSRFDGWYEVHAYPSDVGLSVYFREITERRRSEEDRQRLLDAEREARQSAQAAEQRFRNLVNEVEAIVWEADAQTVQFTFVSQRAEEMLGYPIARWTSEPDFWPNLIYQDDRDWAVDFCLTATREGRDHTFEYRVITADGQMKWLRDIVFVARDEQGRPDKLRGVMVDITERKLVEEERERLMGHVRLLLESTGEGIYGLDVRGRCSFVNRAGAEMLGYAPEELIGQNMHRLIHYRHADGSSYPEEQCPMYRALHAGESCRIEDDLFWRRDGSSFYAAYSASPIIENGQVSGSVVAFYDVTERKEAELSLHFLAEASALFASTLDYEVTLRSLSSLVVPRLGDWYAVFLADEGGKPQNLVVAHHDPDKVALAEELLRRYPPAPDAAHGAAHVIRTGESELVVEVPDQLLESLAQDAEHLRILRELGLKSWMAVPLMIRGRAIGVITIVAAESGRHYDHDDLALAEELARRAAVAIDNARLFSETQELNADLERRVEERTAELEAALKELESFSYSVSHDLRAPLRSMDGFSLALLEDYSDQLDAEGRDYLQRVRAASQRMAQLIDDLLQLSRVTRSELRRETINLSQDARAIVENLRQQNPRRDAVITIADGMTAEGDSRLVHLALENLIDNAWKFTAKREQARIEVGVIQKDEKQVYFVKDNGAGFDMAYADKLFGAFQRLHSDAEFQGSGIGLATVQRIIRRHGGQIWAEGAVGEGATFYFTL